MHLTRGKNVHLTTSKVNCDMIIAFFQNVMIPRNIKNGQLSCEVYRVSDTTGFVY